MESSYSKGQDLKITQLIGSRFYLILILIIYLIIGYHFIANVYNNVGYTPDQPIPYSHKIHAGDYQMECLYCHNGAEKGPQAGIPTIEQCMGCHSVVAIDKDNIKKLTAIYNEGKAVEWVRIHRLPDHAYFNHKWHLNAGVECETCHGEISEMAVVGQVNRLEMGDCMACHRNSDYSDPYVRKYFPREDRSIVNFVMRYPYLKYIDEITLRSADRQGILTWPGFEAPTRQATGMIPYHNASVQCSICHH